MRYSQLCLAPELPQSCFLFARKTTLAPLKGGVTSARPPTLPLSPHQTLAALGLVIDARQAGMVFIAQEASLMCLLASSKQIAVW